MNFVYKLFTYIYLSDCQGTADRNVGFALLHVPEDATFNNNRSTLYNAKHIDIYHDIFLNTVEDLTIEF
jgi:hypothetical protein